MGVAGLSPVPDDEGYYTYLRPEGKSGGHGVGWSEIPRYSFKVPDGWTEVPVSIADLGGTEVGFPLSLLPWKSVYFNIRKAVPAALLPTHLLRVRPPPPACALRGPRARDHA